MLHFIEFITREVNKSIGDNEASVIRVRDENRLFTVRAFFFTWSTGDTRIIAADIYKRIFGLPSLKITGLENLSNGLIARYYADDRTLEQFHPQDISKGALNSIRATFAFRIMLGMRCNNDRVIVIRNKYPLSKRDMFWNYHVLEGGGKAKVSNLTYNKWFADNSDPIYYVKHFPIWKNKTDKERLDMLFTISSAMYTVAVTYHCMYMYNYAVKNIRGALLHH